jgi:hypothetical protein
MKRCVTGFLAAILGFAASGCAGDGELGHGSFHYLCTSEHDYSCDVLGGFRPDGAIAVGATFDLEYLRNGSDPAARQTLAGVRPASPQVAEEVLDAGQQGLRFKVPGEGAFLAFGADGTVLDFVHMFAADVTEVRLASGTLALDGMGMTTGEARSVTAYPLAAGQEPLLGSMSCTWTSDDETIVTVPTGTTSCAAQLTAVSSGAATIVVQMGDGVSAELAVTVEGGAS